MSQPAPRFTPPAERRLGTGAISQTVKRTKPVRWWHEAIIDDMLAFPLSSNKERALRLGYGEPYLSTIINSDMFKAAYASRREAFNERLDASITGKIAKAANLALDVTIESLEQKRGRIPFKDLVESTDSLLSRLGYGGSAAAGAATQVNVNVNAAPRVTPELLSEAREALRRTERFRALDAPAPALLDLRPESEATPCSVASEKEKV